MLPHSQLEASLVGSCLTVGDETVIRDVPPTVFANHKHTKQSVVLGASSPNGPVCAAEICLGKVGSL